MVKSGLEVEPLQIFSNWWSRSPRSLFQVTTFSLIYMNESHDSQSDDSSADNWDSVARKTAAHRVSKPESERIMSVFKRYLKRNNILPSVFVNTAKSADWKELCLCLFSI